MKRIKYSIVAVLVILLGASAGIMTNDKYFEIVKNIEIFSNVYKELNKNYVEDIDPGELMRIGIDAMVGSLDPFTNYISESQVESYRINNQGRYEGLGILVGLVDKKVTITDVTEGGPADEAGLKVADEILAVNGVDVVGKSDEEVNQIMRGAAGTNVGIKVKRPTTNKTVDVSVARDQFNSPNVPVYEILDGNIAYVSLTTFTEDASRNITNALKALEKESDGEFEGIILDLRNNGGGLLREAIAVSNIFIDKGKPIVSTKGKVRDRDQAYDTRRDPYNTKTPLTVLINKKSASASEIVSGVMQDYDRGVLIGQRSYGKGLVQNTQQVGYNSRVKLTTSKYYIPSGRCIQSVEYKNGEPYDIPDEERSQFKTTNGRIVLDGGGVTPDVKLEEPKKKEFVKALIKSKMIFKYATSYVSEHDSIESADEYRFTDFGQFVKFVEGAGFKFESQKDKKLSKLRKELEESGLGDASKSSLDNLEGIISEDKADDFEENKEILIDLIEEEIINRYYYQKGKIRSSLNSDKEIEEAIRIMRTPAEYNKILAK